MRWRAWSVSHHPGHQHLGQPGAQHRTRALRRRSSYRAALAVLGGYVIGAALAGLFTRRLYQRELVTVSTTVVEEQRLA